MPEKLITAVKFSDTIVDIGDAAKNLPSYCRYRYTREVEYTFDDGTTEKSNITGKTKPKLVDAANSLIQQVANKSIHGIFNDGKFWGTSVKFGIC